MRSQEGFGGVGSLVKTGAPHGWMGGAREYLFRALCGGAAFVEL